MNIRTFELERLQSVYENTVELNLTESGFHPLSLNEILNEEQFKKLHQLSLGYGQTNGAVSLRKRISGLYDDLNKNNILVTNGSAEANFIAAHTLLKPRDEILMMVPNYMQLWGIVEEMGCCPKAFHLVEKNKWAPDLDELRKKVNDKTRMITLCNPNNPTGYVLTKEEMKEIVKIADSVGAWIYSDEIYRGSELNYKEIPSFIGMYDKVLVNGGLSKAYALPGLRLGWLAGPKELIENGWAYHDYTTISASIISQYIGEIVLQSENRTKILKRNRDMLNQNLKFLKRWINQHGSLFRFVSPQAGGMAFMGYDLDINSTELSDWLRVQESIFVLPGDCYGMDHYIRIGIGEKPEAIQKGLNKVTHALKERFSRQLIDHGAI